MTDLHRLGAEWDVPPPDADTAAWWNATRDGRLSVQHCRRCGHYQHYPRSICTACHCDQLELVESSGGGTIWSFSVVHRSPGAHHKTPYTIALVRLDEGPVLLTRIVGAAEEQVQCDQRVRVVWQPLADGRRLPVFKLDER